MRRNAPSRRAWRAISSACRATSEAARSRTSSTCPTTPGRSPCGTPRAVGSTALGVPQGERSEEHTSELQSHHDLVCRLLLEKKKNKKFHHYYNQTYTTGRT